MAASICSPGDWAQILLKAFEAQFGTSGMCLNAGGEYADGCLVAHLAQHASTSSHCPSAVDPLGLCEPAGIASCQPPSPVSGSR